jgi:hypothetical protein
VTEFAFVRALTTDNWSRLQFRLNRFLTSRPEMISAKDNLVGWTVVPELPLATAGVFANAGW